MLMVVTCVTSKTAVFFHQKANFGGAARHGVSNVGNKIDLFNFAGGK